MTRANADGSYPVYIIVKNRMGRFFVNSGMTTCGRLEGRSFPKKDKNGRQKTVVLGNLIANTERICLQYQTSELTNKELKAKILAEVMGVAPKGDSTILHSVIAQFADTKRDHTRTLYMITARKVEAYDSRATLDIDATWLESFRRHCIDEGMRINGAGKEMRNIRAVFNWARRQGKTKNYPFLDYSIKEEETLPNNITVEELRRLRDYPCEPWQQKYRDFFMLSFYLAGMNPVDLLTCKDDAVKSGHISFVRKKTDKEGKKSVQLVVLPVVPQASEILSRYKSNEGWLLSFMDGRADYHSFLKKCNEGLKKIGDSHKEPDKLGKLRRIVYEPILPDITMYTARYTFGSIAANDLDISERTIGMCLGHSWSKNVTSRYMANDQRKIDAAVSRVVEFVSRE